MASSYFKFSSTTLSKMKLLGKFTAYTIVVPSIPIGAWYYNANEERKNHVKEVRSRIRVPNVQTVDDIMVEKCQPGDVVLFDRRCHMCANGPAAAFSCILGKALLCDAGQDGGRSTGKSIESGSFEHIGIIVPGHVKNKSDAYDPSNLLLLEATPSEGIVARPLLNRLEMTQSRTVLLLPLSTPGEKRNNDSYEPSPKTKRLQKYMNENLSKFRDRWEKESQKQNYGSGHATLGIIGSLANGLGLQKTCPSPTSPSAWLVLSALQEAGAATNYSDRAVMETKVEDFLRDHRFCEGENVVRLRPGWKFMKPVIMRETGRS